MGRHTLKSFLSDLLLGIGFIFTISPIFLYWFIHGDYNRYIGIINGSYPFSHFGGGPFQLFMYVSLLMVGVGLVVISMIIKKGIE